MSIYTFLNNDNNKYYSDMESVIYNINNKNKVSDSEKFTRLLIKNFDKNNVNMLYRPHKYARFAVLSISECPSVLIELGFLSNRFDEKLLRSREYKFKISESIARSVNSYFGIKFSALITLNFDHLLFFLLGEKYCFLLSSSIFLTVLSIQPKHKASSLASEYNKLNFFEDFL